MSGSTDPVDLDIPVEGDLHNLHQGHLDALQKCRDFASSQFQFTKNLQTEVTKLKQQSKEQRDAHTSDKKRWEEERRALEEARVAEVEGLKRTHAAEATAVSVRHSEEIAQYFHDGFTAGATARAKQDEGLVASLENNLADAQRHVAELQAGLKEAVRYRQECLTLQQQVDRLTEEVNAQRSAGCKPATMGNSSGPTPPEDADAAKLLYARIAMLEKDLQIERAARAKERELQQRRLTYETARHIYYKRAYQESQGVSGSSQGKPDLVVREAGGDEHAAFVGPGDGANRAKSRKSKCMSEPSETQSGATEEAQVASVGRVVDKGGGEGPVPYGENALCCLSQQPATPQELKSLCCIECGEVLHARCSRTTIEAAGAVTMCPPCSRTHERTNARPGPGKVEAGAQAEKAFAKPRTSIQSLSGVPSGRRPLHDPADPHPSYVTADPHASHDTADPHASHDTADPHASHDTADPHASSTAHPGCEPGGPAADVHTGAVGRSVLREIFSETLFHPSSQENAHSDEQLALPVEDNGHISAPDKGRVKRNGHPAAKPSPNECTSKSCVPHRSAPSLKECTPESHVPQSSVASHKECTSDSCVPHGFVHMPPQRQPSGACPLEVPMVTPCGHTPQELPRTAAPHAGLPPVSHSRQGTARPEPPSSPGGGDAGPLAPPHLLPAVSNPSEPRTCSGQDEDAEETEAVTQPEVLPGPSRDTRATGDGEHALDLKEVGGRDADADQCPARDIRLGEGGVEALKKEGGDRQSRYRPAAAQPPAGGTGLNEVGEEVPNQKGGDRQSRHGPAAPQPPTGRTRRYKVGEEAPKQQGGDGQGRCGSAAPHPPQRVDSRITIQEPCTGSGPLSPLRSDSGIARQEPFNGHSPGDSETPTSHLPGKKSRPRTSQPARKQACSPGRRSKAASGQQRKRQSPDVPDVDGPGKVPVKFRRCDLGEAEHAVDSHRLLKSRGKGGFGVPYGEVWGAEHRTILQVGGVPGNSREQGAAQAVNTFSHVAGSAQVRGSVPAESAQGAPGFDPLKRQACYQTSHDPAGAPVRPCDRGRSPGQGETDDAGVASAPGSPCSSGRVREADQPGSLGGRGAPEACAAAPSKRKAVPSRSVKCEARIHVDLAGKGVRDALTVQRGSTSELDRVSGKALNPLSRVRAPASVEHLPPPPPRNGEPGWRQRRPADPFGGFGETLALLDLGQALSPARPPPPSTKPAVVDRVRRGASGAPALQSSTGYKYHAVIRRKSEREQLDGVECEHCKRFYDALDSWGTFDRPPPCGHIPAGQKQGAEQPHLSRQKMCQDASRHRYRDVPPATPTGFWDMGFQDSLDSRF